MVGCQSDLLYLRDEDVSHYVDVATDIAYPDIDEPAGPSVMDTQAPHTPVSYTHLTLPTKA